MYIHHDINHIPVNEFFLHLVSSMQVQYESLYPPLCLPFDNISYFISILSVCGDLEFRERCQTDKMYYIEKQVGTNNSFVTVAYSGRRTVRFFNSFLIISSGFIFLD